jgi:hypothetical protein
MNSPRRSIGLSAKSRLMFSAALLTSLVLLPNLADARCLAQGRWAYGSCGGGGYTSRGGGGGGYNYGAAAAAGVAVLGAMINNMEQQRQAEQNAANSRAAAAANAQRAARTAACNRNYQMANEANSEANETLDRWDPGGAIPHYERAISLLSACGDRNNVGIVKRNLGIAQKHYAALRADNRVSDAQSRYAKQNIYTAPNPFAAPRNASGSSSAPGTPWSGRREDCESAGSLERNTAAWFDMCVWDGTKQPERYQPKIDPQRLSLRAKEQCRSVPVKAAADCVLAAKVKIVMTEDAEIRARCSGAADKLVECVDINYVYGPNGRHKILRDMLLVRINAMGGTTNTRPANSTAVLRCNSSSPFDTCRPYGDGSMPGSADAAGATSPDAQASSDQASIAASAAAMTEYRNRLFDDVASASVEAAAKMLKSDLTAEERRECAITAFHAVRSQMAGGNPPVPPKCAALVDVARSRLAYYAATRLDTGPSQEEDPLKHYLGLRNASSKGLNSGDLGRPAPGMQDLTPDERVRAEGECLRAGGTADQCTKAGEGR